MKIHRLISIGLIALFLAACGAKEMTDQGRLSVINDNDKAYFDKGINKLDTDYCEDIVAEQLKSDCLNIVESKLIIKNAAENKDKETCNAIKIVEYKDRCVREVEEKIAEGKKEEEARKKTEESSLKTSEILESKDVNRCKELLDLEAQSACQDTIYLDLASNNNDPSLCEKIKDPETKAQCQ